ncbi:MAG: helix-turn-helix transcriptional regulator [Firmicutes bacterium]|nr:helix-turn-helix transcriptional regulator [Bacillota bacterium]
MGIKKAILIRLNQLCTERNLKLNALANLSGITSSTIYSIFDKNRKDMGVIVLKKLCDGLGISIIEFFDDDVFKNLDQEIK